MTRQTTELKVDGCATTIKSIPTPVRHRNGVSKQNTDATETDRLRNRKLFTCGTWNVNTLRTEGDLEQLCKAMERYRWGVVGLSEVRRKGMGEDYSQIYNHKLYFSGRDDLHLHGVGFLVHEDTLKHVMGCKPISSRLITIRLRASPFNMTLIQVYAPTTEYLMRR